MSSNNADSCRTLLNVTDCHRTLPNVTGRHRMTPKCNKILQNVTKLLPNVTKCYWTLLNVTERTRILPLYSRTHPGPGPVRYRCPRPAWGITDRHTSTLGPLDTATAEDLRVGRQTQTPLSAPLPRERDQTFTN